MQVILILMGAHLFKTAPSTLVIGYSKISQIPPQTPSLHPFSQFTQQSVAFIQSLHIYVTVQHAGGAFLVLSISKYTLFHSNTDTYYVFFFICDILHVMAHEDNSQNQVNNSKNCVQPKKIIAVRQNIRNMRNRKNQLSN